MNRAVRREPSITITNARHGHSRVNIDDCTFADRIHAATSRLPGRSTIQEFGIAWTRESTCIGHTNLYSSRNVQLRASSVLVRGLVA